MNAIIHQHTDPRIPLSLLLLGIAQHLHHSEPLAASVFAPAGRTTTANLPPQLQSEPFYEEPERWDGMS